MRHRTKRRLSLLILLVGLPLYILIATGIMAVLNRPPIWVEILIYAALGLLWALPFKAVFRGVGQAAPDDDPDRRG
ncbi:MAG: hypothetical protein CSA72_04770 [Rhodobacterales bacterium]|nr:MAG: hypothetical protein CSA72_04770 [Rhodobacterales bacterium]